MRPIRVSFRHFWRGFDWRSHFGFLDEHFRIEESDDADFVIFCVFVDGRNAGRMPRLDTKTTRIFYTPENVPPDMRHCDFAFGFVHEDHVGSDRYRRLPNYPLRLWASGFASEDLIKPDLDAGAVLAGKRRFCNFIYSNPRCAARNAFFEKLSRYKRVDAPGAVCNNLPGVLPRPGAYADVRPKLDFVRPYKFTIAFENESSPGYTTEKIVEPMLVHSLPIYWGDPLVGRDFETRSFLNYFDACRSLDELVDLVVAVDRDDRLYEQYLRQPYLIGNRLPPHLERKRVADWFGRILGNGSDGLA
jgi:alpha(1,3/1,4) fucosyltransferase